MSRVNPRGYGMPIVGVFKTNGEPVAYASLLQYATQLEHSFIMSKCSIEDNEEDGITADITLDSPSPNLVDSPIFAQGNTIVIKFGYIQDGQVGFGAPYFLIVKDYKVSFGETISTSISLVDEKTFTSLSKPDTNQIIDQTRSAILEAAGEELDVVEFENGLRSQSRIALRNIFMQVNKIRDNFAERDESYVYRYKGDFYRTYEDLKVAASKLSPAYTTDITGLNDEEIKKKFRVHTSEMSTVQKIGFKIGRFFNGNRGYYNRLKPVKDLYGFTIGDKQGHQEWVDTLKRAGLWDYIISKDTDQPTYNHAVYNSRGELDMQKVDEIIDMYLMDAVLKRAEEDLNISKYNNLEKYLRSMFGGPHLITDKGDGNGVVVKDRQLEARPFLVLEYKGGDGDFLSGEFSTSFDEPEFTESEVMTVDPETGEMVASTDIGYNDNGSPSGGVKQFVNQALQAVANGTQMPDRNSMNNHDLPHIEYDTKAPSYLKSDMFYTTGVDNTAYRRSIPSTYYQVAPDSIGEIIAELENRRGDLNLKRIIGDIKILGNPSVRSGQIFEVRNVSKKFSGRYYALSVSHNIDPNSGYITTLELGKIQPITTSAKVVSKQEESIVDRTVRRWVYKDVPDMGYDDTIEYLNRTGSMGQISDPDREPLFSYSLAPSKGFYDPSTGKTWPTGIVLEEFKPANFYNQQTTQFKSMSLDLGFPDGYEKNIKGPVRIPTSQRERR